MATQPPFLTSALSTLIILTHVKTTPCEIPHLVQGQRKWHIVRRAGNSSSAGQRDGARPTPFLQEPVKCDRVTATWLRLIGGEGKEYQEQGQINELMSKKEGMTEGEDGGKRERRKGRESTSGGERKEASERRLACFYGHSGKIWGEGILHHHGRPMGRLS